MLTLNVFEPRFVVAATTVAVRGRLSRPVMVTTVSIGALVTPETIKLFAASDALITPSSVAAFNKTNVSFVMINASKAGLLFTTSEDNS